MLCSTLHCALQFQRDHQPTQNKYSLYEADRFCAEFPVICRSDQPTLHPSFRNLLENKLFFPPLLVAIVDEDDFVFRYCGCLVLTPKSLVGGCRRFGRTVRIHS